MERKEFANREKLTKWQMHVICPPGADRSLALRGLVLRGRNAGALTERAGRFCVFPRQRLKLAWRAAPGSTKRHGLGRGVSLS